nr:SDR family NAD(P)-dependent oxidoreductase [Cytophagales bacterium]
MNTNRNIAIIGASGAIGCAFVNHLAKDHNNHLYAFSRSKKSFSEENVKSGHIDFEDEQTIVKAAESIPDDVNLDLIIVASGILHGEGFGPEKSLRDLDPQIMHKVFHDNTYGPMIVAKHFLPRIHKEQRSVFAALSARVSSISDNYLGGWYSYRASKTALNMMIKTASIEVSRRYKKSIIVGIHPGTVDSDLSKPFQSNVKESKLFAPEFSTEKMLEVLDGLEPNDTGKLFAWDGKEIMP